MTLEDLPTQPPATLDALPVEVLARLQGQAQTRLAGASQMVAILHGVLTRRYAQGLNETGTHRRTDGDFERRSTSLQVAHGRMATVSPSTARCVTNS